MNIKNTLLLAPLLVGSLAGTASAQTSISVGVQINSSGHASVDRGYFYDDLAQYGDWVERPRYGWVWQPRVERSSWRPYEDGHWAWTDEGWTWISEEPYGWATYHYGRWYDDPDYGWEWVPGDEYAPAWVSWQESDDYVGWAPLPPSVDFRPGINLSVRLAPEALRLRADPAVPGAAHLLFVVPRARYGEFYSRTRNVTRYNRVNNRIYNQGVSIDRIQRVTGRQVTRYRVADLSPDQRHRGARIERNQVTIFRPQVRNIRVAPPSQRPAWKRAQETRVLANRPQRAPRASAPAYRPAPDQRDHRERAQVQQQKAQDQRRQAQVNQERSRNQRQKAEVHQQRAQGHQQKARAERQKAREHGKQHGNDKHKPPQQ